MCSQYLDIYNPNFGATQESLTLTRRLPKTPDTHYTFGGGRRQRACSGRPRPVALAGDWLGGRRHRARRFTVIGIPRTSPDYNSKLPSSSLGSTCHDRLVDRLHRGRHRARQRGRVRRRRDRDRTVRASRSAMMIDVEGRKLRRAPCELRAARTGDVATFSGSAGHP